MRVMTGLIVVATRHVAAATDDLHVFMRVTALLTVTVVVLMVAHVSRSRSGPAVYALGRASRPQNAGAFEFAFENYTALGYGDAVAGEGYRLIGPDHRAQRAAADRLVGRHHFRGHADGRGADRTAARATR